MYWCAHGMIRVLELRVLELTLCCYSDVMSQNLEHTIRVPTDGPRMTWTDFPGHGIPVYETLPLVNHHATKNSYISTGVWVYSPIKSPDTVHTSCIVTRIRIQSWQSFGVRLSLSQSQILILLVSKTCLILHRQSLTCSQKLAHFAFVC